MMTLLVDCMHHLAAPADGEAVAGCFQAQATVDASALAGQATTQAAIIGAEAAKHSAIIARQGSYYAVFASLLGVLALLLPAYLSYYLNKRASRATASMIFLAEIESLENFLDDNDFFTVMEKEIDEDLPHTFHPGDHWLKSYELNPSGIGALSPEIAKEIVMFCCEALTQLKNLRWLADNREVVGMMAKIDFDKKVYNETRIKTFNSLAQLMDRAGYICKLLRTSYEQNKSPWSRIASKLKWFKRSSASK